MTLNVRIRTSNSSIHFSDGRKSADGKILDEHCKKIIAKEKFILSLAGYLDRIDAKVFDIYERLNNDLVYDDNYIIFRESIFDLVCNEYSKDNTLHWPISCDLMVSYISKDGKTINETL